MPYFLSFVKDKYIFCQSFSLYIYKIKKPYIFPLENHGEIVL